MNQIKEYLAVPNLSELDVLEWAQSILEARFKRSNYLTNPSLVRGYLQAQLATEEREVFALILLDSQHRVLGFEKLFYGTIDSASVYPREVINTVLNVNPAAVIIAHNQPSGNPELGCADLALTEHLKNILALIDVQVLDHIAVGTDGCMSLVECG